LPHARLTPDEKRQARRHARALEPDATMRQFAKAFRVTSHAFRTTERLCGGTTCRSWPWGCSHSRFRTRPRPRVPRVKPQPGRLKRRFCWPGPSVAGLPIALAALPPDEASRGVEAWTLRTAAGNGERIVVYSGSGLFRCASDPHRLDYQCLLRLACAIIHEAWHYQHGLDEAAAYDTQIAFLTLHGSSTAQIATVRLARDYVLAAQRAIERRRR
jgi:hypothetical protein